MPLSAQEVESINERFTAWVNETSDSMGVSRHDVMITSLFCAACYFEVVLGKIEAKHLIDQVASTVGTIQLPYVPSWSRQVIEMAAVARCVDELANEAQSGATQLEAAVQLLLAL